MKEIDVGQVWISKHGSKSFRHTIRISKKLNAKCWEVEHDSSGTEIMNDSQIKEEYAISKYK